MRELGTKTESDQMPTAFFDCASYQSSWTH